MTAIFNPALDLSHLLPNAQRTAGLPNAERIARIRADRWIGYSRACEMLVHLEELFTWPKRQRMPNLLIIGPTNNGKSMLIEKFRRTHPAAIEQEGHKEIIPVVVMQMPSDPSLSRFYNLLLMALGAPIKPRARIAELESLALRLLHETKVRVLIIDELHNMLVGSSVLQRTFLNLLRFLGNALKIPIVGAGTKEAYLAIRSDDQLENRFQPTTLPRWEEGEELMALLASFSVFFPLRKPSELHRPEIARYIVTKTEGTIGEITALLTRAAITAIESGEEAITQQTLALADYDSPTERRCAFERELI